MGFSFEKVMVILLIAALIIGPERLPGYASRLAAFVRRARSFVDQTTTRVKEEAGEEFSDLDWRELDPRQYDPRRIIRDAWNEPDESAPGRARRPASGTRAQPALGTAVPETAAQTGTAATVFDDEAT